MNWYTHDKINGADFADGAQQKPSTKYIAKFDHLLLLSDIMYLPVFDP